MIEALTQSVPVWADSLRESVRLPANTPLSFAGIVQRCMASAAASRPAAVELLSPYKSAPRIQVISTPLAPSSSARFLDGARVRGSSAAYMSLFTIAGALVVFLVIWAALRSPA